MNRIILFILGLIMSSMGLSYIIMYLNLLVIGYSFIDYLIYIFTKLECIIFFVGYILLLLSIVIKSRKENDIHV